jgi:hypothetical protein
MLSRGRHLTAKNRGVAFREWEALSISESGGDNVVTRREADELLAVARRAHASLRLGGTESRRVLVDGVRQLRAQQVVGVLAAPNVGQLSDRASQVRVR